MYTEVGNKHNVLVFAHLPVVEVTIVFDQPFTKTINVLRLVVRFMKKAFPGINGIVQHKQHISICTSISVIHMLPYWYQKYISGATL